MKTKEFKARIGDIGLSHTTVNNEIRINHNKFGVVATVKTDEMYGHNIREYFSLMGDDEKRVLFESTLEYAMTPIEDREEIKKFIFQFPHMITNTRDSQSQRHIAKNITGLALDSSSESFVRECQNFHFTEEEVEQYEGLERALFDACIPIELE